MFSDCFKLRIGFNKPHSSSTNVSKIRKGTKIEFLDNLWRSSRGSVLRVPRSESRSALGGMGRWSLNCNLRRLLSSVKYLILISVQVSPWCNLKCWVLIPFRAFLCATMSVWVYYERRVAYIPTGSLPPLFPGIKIDQTQNRPCNKISSGSVFVIGLHSNILVVIMASLMASHARVTRSHDAMSKHCNGELKTWNMCRNTFSYLRFGNKIKLHRFTFYESRELVF